MSHPVVGGQHGHGVAAGPQPVNAALDLPEQQAQVHLRSDRVQPVLEFGHYTEVAAAAAQCPKQIRMLSRRCQHGAAIGKHDLGRLEAVDHEAVPVAEPAHPAAEGEAAYAGVADHTAGHGQAVGLGGRVHLGPGRPASGPGTPAVRVDDDPAHRPEVNHQPVVTGRGSAERVAPATHRDLQPDGLRERDPRGHVRRRGAAHDDCRASVEVAVPQRPRRVVPRVIRNDHRPRPP